MSEEEILEDIKSLSPSENAILGLLDLYNKEKLNSFNLSEQLNKEKEKNKKIEDKIKRKIEWYQQYCDLDDQTIRALEDILE